MSDKSKVMITNWDKLPLVLDLKTVALIFDVRQETVKHWLYDEKIRGFKIGAKWHFNKDYIREITEQGFTA